MFCNIRPRFVSRPDQHLSDFHRLSRKYWNKPISKKQKKADAYVVVHCRDFVHRRVRGEAITTHQRVIFVHVQRVIFVHRRVGGDRNGGAHAHPGEDERLAAVLRGHLDFENAVLSLYYGEPYWAQSRLHRNQCPAVLPKQYAW